MAEETRNLRWLRYALVAGIGWLLTTCSFAAGIVVCLLLSASPQDVGLDSLPLDGHLAILQEAWDIVELEYYHPERRPDPPRMIHGAIRGMLASLGDRSTVFLDPAETAVWEDSSRGSFAGIGATVQMIEDRLVIVSTLDGSPAQEAGLLPNDAILAVGGHSVADKDLSEVITLIRGPVGTVVELTIDREGEPKPLQVAIERKEFELHAVESQMMDDGIAYLRVSRFNAPAGSQIDDALEELVQQSPKGLILDLRSNPGGFLTNAVYVAAQFVGEGTVLIERGAGSVERQYSGAGEGLAPEIPLVVLVDGDTASASEIVAGAIQDYGRGIVIGVSTYGKGSVQNVHRLSDGSSMRVTSSYWYTANDRGIDEVGLAPDIVVELTEEDIAQGRDPQLDQAREYLLAR